MSGDKNVEESVGASGAISVMRAKEDVIPTAEITHEDVFEDYYLLGDKSKGLIKPPFPIDKLQSLCQENNTLPSCVDIMEINIDGTGYTLTPVDEKGGASDDVLKDSIEEIFDEPYPETSFLSIRRTLRRDLEQVGHAYLEVLRNAQGDIIFFRRVPPANMRIRKLSDPVTAKKSVVRGGKKVELNVSVRERSFAYTNGATDSLKFYKEFNASRDLDTVTGEWAENGKKLPYIKRATEIIYFTAVTMDGSPYGIPRWIPQIPSVIGSRQAEELNLEFFESGGVPPIMVLLSGGKFSEDSRKDFEGALSGSTKKKLSAAILEVYSTSGSLDKDNKPEVKIERFGAEQQKDAMFEKYDERSEYRVRKAFRLPSIFFGDNNSYNYATAYASYLVAEAQVFQPERMEFDTIINNTLMKALDPERRLVFKSNPLNISDLETKLKGLELVKDSPLLDPEEYLAVINRLTDLGLVTSLDKTMDDLAKEPDGKGTNPPTDQETQTTNDGSTEIAVEKVARGLAEAKRNKAELPASVVIDYLKLSEADKIEAEDLAGTLLEA